MYIVKVPGINGLGKTAGCRDAGNAVIERLRDIYSSESGKEIKKEGLQFEEIHVDNSNVDDASKLIYKNGFDSFEGEAFSVFLGGDHSVSYSLGRAFLDHCENRGAEPCLVVFDAHPDCMEPIDKEAPTHEEWLRGLIEKGFPAKNILLVGVRNSWKSESEFLKFSGIRTVSINQILLNIEDTCDVIMEFASGKELYVSVDIDVVDPAFAPATHYCEPGGLTSRQLVYLVQRLRKVKGLRAFDIVEINSEKDDSGITTKLGAKILAELI